MKELTTYEMNEESRDLLLFNYLEGNLTEERAAMLEKALSTDHELQAELELWKESFMEQEFYATDALEDQLLQKVKNPFSFSGPAAGFLLLLVASLFSFIPTGEEEHVAHSIKRVLPDSPVAAAASGEKASETAVCSDAPAIQTNSAPHPREEQQAILIAPPVALTERIEAMHYVIVGKSESWGLFPDINLPVVIKSKEQPTHLHSSKEISRKKERQIRRMKEKGLKQKRANKFIKGNRPYVVPLDTRNF